MKTVRLFGFLLSTFLLCIACGGGNEEEPTPTPTPTPSTPTITIDNSIITNGLSFSETQGESSITFTTDADWTLSVAETRVVNWCIPSATSGQKGNSTVKFSVTENTGYDDRSVAVTIKAGSTSKTFKITQKQKDALLVTTNKYEIEQIGGEIEVEVKANIDYQIEIAENAKSWINETSTRALAEKKHQFIIAPSVELEKREGEIYVKSGDKIETITIYQSGGATIILSQKEFNVSDVGDVIAVDIRSNVEYGVQLPEVDWISEEVSTRGVSSHTLKFVINANEGYDSRTAEIIFYDKNNDLKEVLTITQSQKDAIVLSQTRYDVFAQGCTIEVVLATNIDFLVSIDSSWIKQIDGNSTRGLSEYRLCFIIDENTSGEIRTATITITDQESNISQDITIKQSGTKEQIALFVDRDTFVEKMSSLVGCSQFYYNLGNVESIDFLAEITSIPTDNYIVLSTKDSYYPIYATFNNQKLTITTEGKEFVLNTDCFNMFNGYRGEVLDLSKLNTSRVVNMAAMFQNCYNLKQIDLSSFDTNNVKYMYAMFLGCTNLESVDFSSFNTINVTNMNNMFSNCRALTSIDLTPLNTSNVTNMSGMFSGCALTSIDLTPLNTLNVTDMSSMFSGSALTSIDLTPLNTSNVTDMSSMFSGSALTSIDLTPLNTSNVTDMSHMFGYCSALTSIDLTPLNTSNVTDMSYMFTESVLTSIDLTPLNTSNVTNMSGMFSGCKSLTSIDLTPLNTSNVTNMSWMFHGCTALTSIDLTPLNTSKVTDMSVMFGACKSLISIDLTPLNTSNVTDMNSMFCECTALTSIDLASLNTSNVTDMNYMFSTCKSLISIDLTSFNTSNVTDMSYIFAGCESLTSLDVSGFDTHKVTNMSGMFAGCESLTSLDVSGLNTSRVTNMHYMFCNCSNLTSLDVSGFNTSKVTRMSWMFKGCNSLTLLNVSKFNTSGVTDMSYMFSECESLTSMDISGLNIFAVTDMSRMFLGCKNITEVKMGGIPSNLASADGMFSYINTEGILYYNTAYEKQYSKIIAELPKSWTAVPTTF